MVFGNDVIQNNENVDSSVSEIDGDHEVESTTDMKRGPGRPKSIKTGSRGRPRKEYNMVPNQVQEELVSMEEPRGNEQAGLIEENKPHEAIMKEYLALIKSKTWEIVEKPENIEVMGNRLILSQKHNADGELKRNKARLVAKGYAQQPGRDFDETFAPVARASSIRLIMALSVELGLEVHQMDVVTAYLNGYINEKIYMQVPENLEEILREIVNRKIPVEKEIYKTSRKWLTDLGTKENPVCLVKKALYGLKQSGRQWYKRLDSELRKIGMNPLNADPCIYYAKKGKEILIVTIYVDDIILASNSPAWMKKVKSELNKVFEMKDLGCIRKCLGIDFMQDRRTNTITMSQEKYIESILERFKMMDCKPIGTPLDANSKLKKPEIISEDEMKKYPYQELIGSLMYLATSTRPDISFAVSTLSQFNNCYNYEHWNAGKRVLRYLKGTKNKGLIFTKTNSNLIGFVDADWGSCIVDRRSYTGFVFMLAGAAVSWESKKQRTVALSSTEAEYMGLCEASKEASYLNSLLCEINMRDNPIMLYNDSLSAQQLVKNPVLHSRSKHIDVRYHFIREMCEMKIVKLEYLETEKMLADVLTKGLHKPKYELCINGLGLNSIN